MDKQGFIKIKNYNSKTLLRDYKDKPQTREKTFAKHISDKKDLYTEYIRLSQNAVRKPNF